MKKTKSIFLGFCIFLIIFSISLIPFGAKTQGVDSRFGVNAFVLNRYGWQEWDKPISLLKDLGVSWTREEFVWKQIEPERGRYDWGFYDRAFASLSKSGINVLGIIDYSAPWATEDPNRENADKYMPSISDWENYVGKVVDRYGGYVKYWQIWNEPNIEMFFKPAPNVAQYFELLKSASNIIRSKGKDFKIVLAGTSGVDTGYLQQLKNLGAENYFDILTVHPYRLDFKTAPEVGGLFQDLQKAETLSNTFGGKPIWLTEVGWPTDILSDISEETQAKYLVRTYLAALSFKKVEKIFWYDFRNDGSNNLDREQNFGLLNRDYGKKKSYQAYKTLIYFLENSVIERKISNGESGVYDFLFSNAGKKVRVIWKVNGGGLISINENIKESVFFDIYGKEISFNSNSGIINISDSPVFILDNEVDISSVDILSGNINYDFEYIDQSPFLSLKQGERKEVWLKLKNIGESTWHKNGQHSVLLGTCLPNDRISPFYSNESWIGANRSARMQEDKVKKGETATFVFYFSAEGLKEGSYKEYFCPVAEGIAWMKNIGIFWGITVDSVGNEDNYGNSKDYSFQFVDQSGYLGLQKGEKKTVFLKLKNTGLKNWEKGSFNLGTAKRKDRASIFNKNWNFANRIILDQDIVKPGETGSFTFDFTAPELSGSYKEYFRPVVEGVGWLNDLGIFWKINVI